MPDAPRWRLGGPPTFDTTGVVLPAARRTPRIAVVTVAGPPGASVGQAHDERSGSGRAWVLLAVSFGVGGKDVGWDPPTGAHAVAALNRPFPDGGGGRSGLARLGPPLRGGGSGPVLRAPVRGAGGTGLAAGADEYVEVSLTEIQLDSPLAARDENGCRCLRLVTMQIARVYNPCRPCHTFLFPIRCRDAPWSTNVPAPMPVRRAGFLDE
ncbi:hypothetical protein BH24ACT5_BH24ACT5_31220 [soil metagenome]